MRLVGVVLLIAAGLAGCSQPTRVAENKKPMPMSHSHQLVPDWYAQSGKGAAREYLRLSPALANGVVYSVDTQGDLYAFDQVTGKARWEQNTSISFSSGPGVGQNRLLVGSRDGGVYAYDLTAGGQLWRTQVSTEVLSTPAYDDSVVVVQAADGQLFGLDTSSGKRLWVYQSNTPALTLRGNAAPLIAKGRVYAGFANGKLVALSLTDGKLLWEQVIAQPRGRTELERMVDIDANPVLLGDTLYAVTYQGRLVALEVATGRLRWSRDLSSYSGMAFDARYLYVTDSEGAVQAFDQNDGATLWKQARLSGRQLSAPAVVQGVVIFGDDMGIVTCLSAEDGSFISRNRLSTLANKASGNRWEFVAVDTGSMTAQQPSADIPIRSVLAATPDGVIVHDANGVMVSLRLQRLKDRH